MIIIQDIIISDDIVDARFMCNLQACQGACCWEGDFGAPLEDEEMEALASNIEDLAPYLDEPGLKMIETKGPHTWYEGNEAHGTTLLENGACVYMTRDRNGIAQCGIEQAWQHGDFPFRKPISCHLYPVRVQKLKQTGTEALNYDRWEICTAACERGREEQVPLYKFVKEALIRKYGQDFYEELDALAAYLKRDNAS